MSKVIIYGASYCVFCIKAKNFLSSKNVPLTWINVEEEEGQAKLLQLHKQYNWKTIPMIFVEDKFIGGYTEMMKEIKNRNIVLDDLM